jgi:hypothetical protein
MQVYVEAVFISVSFTRHVLYRTVFWEKRSSLQFIIKEMKKGWDTKVGAPLSKLMKQQYHATCALGRGCETHA